MVKRTNATRRRASCASTSSSGRSPKTASMSLMPTRSSRCTCPNVACSAWARRFCAWAPCKRPFSSWSCCLPCCSRSRSCKRTWATSRSTSTVWSSFATASPSPTSPSSKTPRPACRPRSSRTAPTSPQTTCPMAWTALTAATTARTTWPTPSIFATAARQTWITAPRSGCPRPLKASRRPRVCAYGRTARSRRMPQRLPTGATRPAA